MGYSNILTLTGLPCSGKTTIGKLLAKSLNFNFIDLDKYITLNHKLSIVSIFNKYGENKFRKYETTSLKEIIKSNKSNLVLSLGGGTICFNNNLNFCLNNSKLIWLNTCLQLLYKRIIKKEIKKRPLLSNNNNISKTLQELYKQRLPFYNKSHIIINVENENYSEIINNIIKSL